ncbi:MAG: hypothetical protein IJ403_10695 [Oscillospiraceae bacterium]|nr:hypothetical protein [Oscillospiraceae bacterium]
MNNGDLPIRIVVEVVSSADVKRLEDRDENIRSEVARLESKLDGLHRTIYELIETIGNIRNKR